MGLLYALLHVLKMFNGLIYKMLEMFLNKILDIRQNIFGESVYLHQVRLGQL